MCKSYVPHLNAVNILTKETTVDKSIKSAVKARDVILSRSRMCLQPLVEMDPTVYDLRKVFLAENVLLNIIFNIINRK